MRFNYKIFLKSVLIISIVSMFAVSCGSSDSKPSKQALTDHYVELVISDGGLGDLVPKSTLEKVYGCLFNEIYDDLSDEQLKKMLAVDKLNEDSEYPIKLTEKEKKSFDDAANKCGEKYSDELNPSSESSGN